MSELQRLGLLLSLTMKLEGWLHEEQSDDWEIRHVPDSLAHLMAKAAMQVMDVVVATEASLDEHGLLVEDGDGVKVA